MSKRTEHVEQLRKQTAFHRAQAGFSYQRIYALEAEAQALREEVAAANERADILEHRLMGVMTRHFAEAWRKRDTDKTLEGYLSVGIAELEGERDAARAEVAALRALLDEGEKS